MQSNAALSKLRNFGVGFEHPKTPPLVRHCIAHLKGGNNYNSGVRTGIIPYTNDTSIIITNRRPKDFKINMSEVFVDISEWFKINWLSLNF